MVFVFIPVQRDRVTEEKGPTTSARREEVVETEQLAFRFRCIDKGHPRHSTFQHRAHDFHFKGRASEQAVIRLSVASSCRGAFSSTLIDFHEY